MSFYAFDRMITRSKSRTKPSTASNLPPNKDDNVTSNEMEDVHLSYHASHSPQQHNVPPQQRLTDDWNRLLSALTARVCRLKISPSAPLSTTSMRNRDDLLLSLRASAEINNASPFDVELQYPSGYKEAFAFGSRVASKTASSFRHAHPILPFEDFVATIRVILTQTLPGDTELRDGIGKVLTDEWPDRENWTSAKLQQWKGMITSINSLLSPFLLRPERTSYSPLHPDLIEHFFNQLHDRTIADVAKTLLYRKGDAGTEATYGELRPKFISTLLRQTNVTEGSVFLDLGSGIGQVVLQAALETGCEAHGIEREIAVHAAATMHLDQFLPRAELYGLSHGEICLHQGDFLTSRNIELLLPEVDVVLVNNLRLDPETDLELLGRLRGGLRKGCRVVSTRRLELGRRRRKRKRGGEGGEEEEDGDGDEERIFDVQEFESEEKAVSWMGGKIGYFISTRR